jgi:putative membrane protein
VKKLSVGLALAGLLDVTLLVARNGADRVFAAILSVGRVGFVAISAWQLVVAAISGLAWYLVARNRQGRGVGLFIWARLVRDASASCLPFSQLGGFVLGARALVLHGISTATASSSTFAYILAEFLAEVVFGLAGLAILMTRLTRGPASLVGLFLAALVVVILVLILAVRGGGTPKLSRLIRPLGGGLDLIERRLAGLRPELTRLYHQPRAILLGILVHLLGWVTKGIGGWLIFRLLGTQLDLAGALAIEGLLHGILAVAVLVPGYAGVQEGAYTILGALFGLPPAISLGVSLLRRARDIAVGIPVLVAWQLIEVGRLGIARR